METLDLAAVVRDVVNRLHDPTACLIITTGRTSGERSREGEDEEDRFHGDQGFR